MAIRVIEQQHIERIVRAARAKVNAWVDEAHADGARGDAPAFVLAVYLAATTALHEMLQESIKRAGGTVTEHRLFRGKKGN